MALRIPGNWYRKSNRIASRITYKISIEDYKNCKLYLQDGLRTKKLDFKNSTHSTSFIPLHPSHL